MRPNIRVEIQNNLVESMDVDENEEGEVSDGEDKQKPENKTQSIHNKTSKSTFMSGIEVLGQNEQKLQERARRFQLNPKEIKNFTDEDLKLLQSSLGINPSNEFNVRFEVIHMRGIEQMNAGDILDYFLEYAPVSVEWIDEESCNVVWSDKLSPARALHFMSKPVRGMPVRDDSSYFDNLNEGEEMDQSIHVINKNREIELQEDPEPVPNKSLNEKNSVDISEITATIPPGYWRLGNKHPNSQCILLRYSLKTDKKHFKVEQFSRYYKSQGLKIKKANLGEKHPSQGIFGRNKDMFQTQTNDENPWSTLAKNWDEDAPFREKERTYKDEEPKIEIKNHSLRVRLGTKRKENEVESEEKEPPKKIKIPRMRMYADEEEEKIKRKKMLKRIDYQMKKIEEDKSNSSDLRTVLNMTSRTHRIKSEPVAEREAFDLGTTLKNRNRRMIFEIKREKDQEKEDTPEEVYYVNRNKTRHVSPPRETRKNFTYSDDEDSSFEQDQRRGKPQSKVAVVIKTQKKPAVASAVASTVWSRVSSKSNNSDSDSAEEESSSADSSDSEAESDEEEFIPSKPTNRPGFSSAQERLSKQTTFKSPLKIEINNDHFKRI